jgi:hypothetical protein
VTPGCSPSSANEQVLFEALMAIHASTSSSILMRFGVLNCVDIIRLSPNTIIVGRAVVKLREDRSLKASRRRLNLLTAH